MRVPIKMPKGEPATIQVHDSRVHDVVVAAEDLAQAFMLMYNGWVRRQRQRANLTQEELYVARLNALQVLCTDIVMEAPSPWPNLAELLTVPRDLRGLPFEKIP